MNYIENITAAITQYVATAQLFPTPFNDFATNACPQ